jgi:C-terminal processing protease CtpA/Prc
MQQQSLKGLVIDLRQNSGGNSALGDKLLEYLTTKKYRMSGGALWKISQPYKDYYNKLQGDSRFLQNTSLERRYLQGGNGTFIKQPAPEKKPAPQTTRFTGPVCFLIGSYTFSSANMLANAVKDYDLATLIGEPTGECPNDFGELLTFRLPHTGIDFYTSTKQYIRANGDAANPDPILPDITAKDDPATAVDEGLEAAKQWIRSKGNNQ